MAGLALALIATVTMAGSPAGRAIVAIDVSGLAPGRYLFEVTRTATGATVNSAPVTLAVAGPGTSPGPGPVDPPIVAGLSKKVADWAGAVDDPTGRRGLSAVYSTVAVHVASGSIKPGRALAAIKATSDAALRAAGTFREWKPFRDQLSAAIVDLRARGDLKDDKTSIGKFLSDVKRGLDAESRMARKKIDLERLLRILELILPIILRFFGG